MSDNQIETIVEKLIPGGDGLARLDGMVVFIPGVLPGEKVKASIIETKKGWVRTGAAEILEASPDRVEPFCPLYGTCGGCSWQHIAYPVQLEAKAAFSREALVRQGGFSEADIPDFQVTSSRPQGYRSRMRPVVLSGGTAGFHAAASDRIIPVTHCPVASDGINKFFKEVPYKLNSGVQPMVFGNNTDFWAEGVDSEAEAVVGGKSFRFPPQLFFQSNMFPLPELIDFAVGNSNRYGRHSAMDFYGGVGLFGAFLADHFEKVIGVDRDKKMGKWWKINVGEKGVFHPVTLEKWVRMKISPKPDFIIVDPPRTGLSASVRQVIGRLKVREIAYVSCNPVTQARDLKELCAAGYILDSYGVFDLYPQTPHVETVARLSLPPKG